MVVVGELIKLSVFNGGRGSLMTTAEMTLIGRLKLIRQELGLTQKDFASGASIGYGLYINVEAGVRNITDKTIHKICDAYSVNERWLRFGEGRMFVDARLDAFDQFVAAFNLDSGQQSQIAKIIQFPLEKIQSAASDNAAKRQVARIVKAIDRGSIGRAMQVETTA